MKYVDNRPQSVRDILPHISGWANDWEPCPALQTIDWQIANIGRLSSVSDTKAVQLWGREMAHAIAYKKTTSPMRKPTWRNPRERPVQYRYEMSLRSSGMIAFRLHYHWYVDRRQLSFGLTSLATLRPMNGYMIVGLVKAWRDLGYMTKIHKGSWVESALVVEMLKNLSHGA